MLETQTNKVKGGWLWTIMLVAYILLSSIVSFVITAIVPSDVNLNSSVAFCAITGVTSSFAILAVVVFTCYLSRKKVRAIEVVRISKTNPLYYVCAILIAVGMLFGLGFVNGLVQELFESLGFSTPDISLPLNNVWAYVIFVFVYALLPAISEELFFRGVLVKSLGENFDNNLGKSHTENNGKNIGKHPSENIDKNPSEKVGIKFSVIITLSVCFALYHASAVQLVYQLLYGAVLCLLTIKAKSVLPTMLAHFINNFAVLTLQFTEANINLYSPIVIVIGLIFLALGLILTFIIANKTNQASKKEKALIDDITDLSNKAENTDNFGETTTTSNASKSTITESQVQNISTENSSKSTAKNRGVVINFWLSGGIVGGIICAILIVMGLFV